MSQYEKLVEANQLLQACGWKLEPQSENGKMVYVVVDKNGVSRRSFIPVDRLFDYARGVFDAQDFSNV